jgi:hypothetical protein
MNLTVSFHRHSPDSGGFAASIALLTGLGQRQKLAIFAAKIAKQSRRQQPKVCR